MGQAEVCGLSSGENMGLGGSTRPPNGARTAPTAGKFATRPRRLGGALSRRAFLSAATRAGLGAAGLALVGCGGDDEPNDPDSPDLIADGGPTQSTPGSDTEPEGSSVAVAQTSALRRRPQIGTPRAGGSLAVHASFLNLDFFDSHRSQFPLTQLLASLQQSKLLRYADVDAGILEPDLVSIPEVVDDETYIFTLRPGARWWDREPTNGRAVTVDDIRLNAERQIAGLDSVGAEDATLLRQSLYSRSASLNILGDDELVLRTDGPDATYLTSVHAGPWSFIQAPEIWDLFAASPAADELPTDLLREDPLQPSYYSGTGPFQIDRFLPNEQIRLIANTHYFRDGKPYLSDFTILNAGSPTEQEAAFRAGQLDVWTPGDGGDLSDLFDAFPALLVETKPLPFGIELAMSYQAAATNPIADPRTARAIHVALDRHAIMNASYGVNGQVSGPAPWYTPGWRLETADLLDQPGYRTALNSEDRAELAGLRDATEFDGPLTIHLPDVFAATYPGLDDVIRSSLEERLGLRVEIAIAQYPTLLEGLIDGSVEVMIGWGTAISSPDPTERIIDTMRTAANGNRGGFSDPFIDTWLDRMRTTLDLGERQAIFRENITPQLLAKPTWLLNIGHGTQRMVHRPDVWLPAFGFGGDGYHWEEAWAPPR
jgi:ABC-type transport system substrate-binding protein